MPEFTPESPVAPTIRNGALDFWRMQSLQFSNPAPPFDPLAFSNEDLSGDGAAW